LPNKIWNKQSIQRLQKKLKFKRKHPVQLTGVRGAWDHELHVLQRM